MRDYLRSCCDSWVHINRSQTLFYKCIVSFTLAFLTALWAPSLIIVLFFALLMEMFLCSVSMTVGRDWCVLSRTGILAVGFAGWICGRALAEHAIGVHDPKDCD